MSNFLKRLQNPLAMWKFLAFAIVAVELAVFTSVSSADSWWQLKAGQALWNGTFTFADQWSFTAHGQLWPDHEVGFQFLFYGLWWLGGNSFLLLSIFGILITLGTLYLLLPPKHLVEKFGGRFGTLSFLLIISFGILIGPYVALRPAVVSFFFTALVIRLILTNKPLWLPLVTLAWIQFHGSVTLGCALIGFAMVLNGVVWLRDRKNIEKKKRFVRFLIATVGAGITLFLSPLGFEFIKYALFETTSYRNSYILEWGNLTDSPELLITGLVFIALVASVVILRLRKILKTWEGLFLIALSLGTFVLALDQLRLLGTFIMISMPILYLGLGARRKPFIKPLPRLGKRTTIAIASAIVALAVGGVSVGLGATLPYVYANPLSGGNVEKVLRSDQCFGKTWNDYNSGGYLLWFMPDIKVSIDSRFDLYPMDVKIATGTYPPAKIVDDGTADLNLMLKKYKIDCYLSMAAHQTKELKDRDTQVLAKNGRVTVFLLKNHQIAPSKKPWDPNQN